VDNTRDYARVSHSRQWSNYNIILQSVTPVPETGRFCSESGSD